MAELNQTRVETRFRKPRLNEEGIKPRFSAVTSTN